MKSQTPIQLLVTTTAMPADVEILDIDITKDKMIYLINLMESIVKLCLSICRSFSKMWSRSQILMLRSIEDVTTQLSVPTTNDLISTILWEKMGWLLKSFAKGHLKVSNHSFHQITSLHVPAEQFLSDKRFHSFVKQITKKLYGSPNPSDCQLIVL